MIMGKLLVLFILLLPTTALGQDGGGSSNGGSSQPRWSQAMELRLELARELAPRWSLSFGRDIHFGTQEATCLRSMRDQFSPTGGKSGSLAGDNRASIVSIDWFRHHAEIVKTISNHMGWHRSAVEAIARSAEELAGNHTFDKNLTYEYVDVHRLQNLEDVSASLDGSYAGDSNSPQPPSPPLDDDIDQSQEETKAAGQEVGQLDADGQLVAPPMSPTTTTTANHEDDDSVPAEPLPTASSLTQAATTPEQPEQMPQNGCANSSITWETPVRQLALTRHRNFGDVLINTDESAVHVPVHIYPCEPQVMNGIAWSDELTKVFKDNFARNPKLTNQYFASQSGFMRLYPAQQWQINRTDPDLYDARMRPWYVAAASSRKDVVILVDASGSMTGSRRDIARGVVFEILDTLTDNDNFLILKFSDTIQQVGLPTCPKLRQERRPNQGIPLKNTVFRGDLSASTRGRRGENETDIEAFFMAPANGRNVRHVKANFTIATSGIANFSQALEAAFEVLRHYQAPESLGALCNQAIMLITDGSPSDFQEIFNRYNIPNAPVRVFTYLIGREATDVGHTKMMACHNRGYYTHVINLAEVRETVQQYIPVMARPLVLNGSHPITWTPAYGELTYQMLTDWIWESKRREKARAILAAAQRGTSVRITSGDEGASDSSSAVYSSPELDNPDMGGGDQEAGDGDDSRLDEDLEALDLFGYQSLECFWETRRNDLLTTVVQPVYDRRNESIITEKFLQKNIWTTREIPMRTAQIQGVAAADMKINDIVALAPSHKLGPNGYAIMLTNNGFVMHHPDLRSVLEPFSQDPSERNMRILKPHFASLDLTQMEHVAGDGSTEAALIAMRQEAVAGLAGRSELATKRTLDCQRRVQTRNQSFYFKPIEQFPFSFMIAIPQPYGSHRLKAQVEIKGSSASLRERLTNHFTTSDYDLWTLHPDYKYCDGPSKNSITTLLDMFQRVEAGKLNDLQWMPAESERPPLPLPSKIVCDKDLVQSLVYDAVATFGFADRCSQSPAPNAESSLQGLFGIRFSFVATRSGLTRVRHYNADDLDVKKEALAFARKHSRAVDETYYQRTVDYNMLDGNENATLIQVPFNTFEKIRDRLANYETNRIINSEDSGSSSGSTNIDSVLSESQSRLNVKDMSLFEKLTILANSSLHVIATQSIVVNEGTQKAVAGVTGAFYDYSSFVMRFFNLTDREGGFVEPRRKVCPSSSSVQDKAACDEEQAKISVKCGHSNDTIDCLLVDNNGYIVVSEDLNFIGRHLKVYDAILLQKLVSAGVFQEINITDYQSICVRLEEKQQASSSASSSICNLYRPEKGGGLSYHQLIGSVFSNLITALIYTSSLLCTLVYAQPPMPKIPNQQQSLPPLPSKTYLRPCEKILTLYESRPGRPVPGFAKHYTTKCNCEAWFVYEQVPKTNLFMLIVDSSASCKSAAGCTSSDIMQSNSMFDTSTDPLDTRLESKKTAEDMVCSNLEREAQLYRKRLDSCFAHHPDEEHIKLCGTGSKSAPISLAIMFASLALATLHQNLLDFIQYNN